MRGFLRQIFFYAKKLLYGIKLFYAPVFWRKKFVVKKFWRKEIFPQNSHFMTRIFRERLFITQDSETYPRCRITSQSMDFQQYRASLRKRPNESETPYRTI